MQDVFHKIANRISTWAGKPLAFVAALFVIGFWAFSGTAFGYSDTWQLVINTGTTIVTFLMVFLIQNTQNRDAKVIHLKLDELLKATKGVRREIVDIEETSDKELEELQAEFKELHEKYAGQLEKRKKKVGSKK